MTFEHLPTTRNITWITAVDSRRMWADFLQKLDFYQRTHAVGQEGLPGLSSVVLITDSWRRVLGLLSIVQPRTKVCTTCRCALSGRRCVEEDRSLFQNSP